ncbi:MAG: alanine racemase [Rikenellaceae bacterium]|nr:alanine racemase [Rikenellaceae bacterium]
MKYTLSQIATLCCGQLIGTDRTVEEITVDSRNYTYGERSMMAAIRGRNHDGHDFIEAAYAHGVRSFLVSRKPEMIHEEAGYVVVEDTLAALQRLAADRRAQFEGQVVAVTGSTDKTLTKEWCAQSAPDGVKIFRSPKSYNSQLGVALSLLMIEGDEQVAIVEAGISHPDQMARLEEMIRPDVAIITNIGEQHAENFASLDAKIAEKLVIARRATIVIYDGAIEPIAQAVAQLSATKIDCRAFADPASNHRDRSLQRSAEMAAALWCSMGCESQDVHQRVSALRPMAMRMELKEGVNGSIILNDSSNADVNSLAIALDALLRSAEGRDCTLIISDDPHRATTADYWRRVAQLASRSGIRTVLGIGAGADQFADLFDCQTRFYATPDELLSGLYPEDIANRAVLVKCASTPDFERMSHNLEQRSHTTVLEVNLDAMRRNLNYYRSILSPSTMLMAMVKASSYGNGRHEIAQMLQNEGVDALAVAFADEGTALRRRGITMPIVVLNADTNSFPVMVSDRLEPEIYSFTSLSDFVEAVKRAGAYRYPIHIKIDSGMHRLGFEERDIPQLIVELERASQYVRVATIFSHLATADDTEQDDFSREQIARYDAISSQLAAALPYRVIRHTAASAAMERFEEARFDMCRLGLGLYGFDYYRNDALTPVATLKARVVQIKRLDETETVGYGRAGRLARKTVTATVSIGYADGLNRRLGCGAWSMLVHGQQAPIVGRICMDCCMIDITDIDGVREGDEVTVFSPTDGNRVDDMAVLLGTIPYEVMTSISTRVKRIFIRE